MKKSYDTYLQKSHHPNLKSPLRDADLKSHLIGYLKECQARITFKVRMLHDDHNIIVEMPEFSFIHLVEAKK
ncbi:MAG: hypothetical protein ACJAV6_000612 [Candidatus Paceibacteria bacterium]|jgi:hypothetical protein